MLPFCLPHGKSCYLLAGNFSSLICCVQISPSFQVYEWKRGPFKVETSPSNILFSFIFYLSSSHQIALNKLRGNFFNIILYKISAFHDLVSLLGTRVVGSGKVFLVFIAALVSCDTMLHSLILLNFQGFAESFCIKSFLSLFLQNLCSATHFSLNPS